MIFNHQFYYLSNENFYSIFLLALRTIGRSRQPYCYTPYNVSSLLHEKCGTLPLHLQSIWQTIVARSSYKCSVHVRRFSTLSCSIHATVEYCNMSGKVQPYNCISNRHKRENILHYFWPSRNVSSLMVPINWYPCLTTSIRNIMFQ